MSSSPSRRPINTSAVSLANSTSHHADCVGRRDGGGSMCGAASVQSVVIRIPYISKWSLGTEKYNSRPRLDLSSRSGLRFTTRVAG